LVLRKIFGHKREEASPGGRRKLHIKELNDLFLFPYITTVRGSRRMG
jgi:hypothetical protein